MIPPGFTCPRRVGFLFPHACERLTSIGCPDCNNNQVNDPFSQRDRYGYSDYDDYSGVGPFGVWRSQHDFTEADGETLIRRRRAAHEDDMTAS